MVRVVAAIGAACNARVPALAPFCAIPNPRFIDGVLTAAAFGPLCEVPLTPSSRKVGAVTPEATPEIIDCAPKIMDAGVVMACFIPVVGIKLFHSKVHSN